MRGTTPAQSRARLAPAASSQRGLAGRGGSVPIAAPCASAPMRQRDVASTASTLETAPCAISASPRGLRGRGRQAGARDPSVGGGVRGSRQAHDLVIRGHRLSTVRHRAPTDSWNIRLNPVRSAK